MAILLVSAATGVQADASRQLYWGDTHLHTSYSFDAFLNGNESADPETAYRWAKGLPVIHPYHRARIRIDTPLDFLVVADHAEYLGVLRKIYYGEGEPLTGRGAEFTEALRDAVDAGKGASLFRGVLPEATIVPGDDRDPAAVRGQTNPLPIPGNGESLRETAWAESTAAADRHNEPGRFTAMIGWEWSSIPNGANLHRVVMTPTDGETARKFMPWSSNDSPYPDDLWSWLEERTNELGTEFVAIPHNPNISKGYMWGATALDGTPYTAESARNRARWEPVAEVTQYKGDSETHPMLSPDDPFADFESYESYIQTNEQEYVASVGDYARSALRRGLEIEERVGANPYKFGMIGATDSHSGVAAAEEDNFWGKMALDSTPETKHLFRAGRSNTTGWNIGAQGLAGVWAEENTRESIFAAFRRREVYASTGPRIQVRFFGGFQFRKGDAKAADLAERGYAKGVPMGGDLTAPPGASSFAALFGSDETRAPSFLVQAAMDPRGATLDRVQIVKGWLDASGQTHERVYDVVWSGDREAGADGRVGPVGNTVDLETGKWTNTIGAAELATVWKDPDFDPAVRAFYYVRVLEIPTPRHSLLDALALQKPPPEGYATTQQERAYSSPIWYTP